MHKSWYKGCLRRHPIRCLLPQAIWSKYKKIKVHLKLRICVFLWFWSKLRVLECPIGWLLQFILLLANICWKEHEETRDHDLCFFIFFFHLLLIFLSCNNAYVSIPQGLWYFDIFIDHGRLYSIIWSLLGQYANDKIQNQMERGYSQADDHMEHAVVMSFIIALRP